MDPYASHIIGQMKMKELRNQAARHRQAAQARLERPDRFRAAMGRWLIGIGRRMLPNQAILELHRWGTVNRQMGDHVIRSAR